MTPEQEVLLSTITDAVKKKKLEPQETENIIDLLGIVSPNFENKKGNTPLILATKQGKADIVDILSHHGANVTYKNRDGYAAIHYATSKKHNEVIPLLAETINSESTRERNTPLHFALKGENKDISTVETLLRHGAMTYMSNVNGDTPLHIASEKGFTQAIEVFGGRSDFSYSVNKANNDGNAPLHLAAKEGHSGAIETLCRLNADINAKNKIGKTPLHLATEFGNIEATEKLCELYVDLEIEDRDGNTALKCAISGNKIDAVKTLVFHGAKINFSLEDLSDELQNAVEEGLQQEKNEKAAAEYIKKSIAFITIKTTKDISAFARYTVDYENEHQITIDTLSSYVRENQYSPHLSEEFKTVFLNRAVELCHTGTKDEIRSFQELIDLRYGAFNELRNFTNTPSSVRDYKVLIKEFTNKESSNSQSVEESKSNHQAPGNVPAQFESLNLQSPNSKSKGDKCIIS